MSLAATLWNKLNNKHIQNDATEQVEIDTASLSLTGSVVSVNGTSANNNVVYSSNGTSFTNISGQCSTHGNNTMTNCGVCTTYSGLGQLIGAGTITSTYSGSLQLQSGPPLTSEELTELENLRQDRTAESKRLKIEEFKKLPADFRQTVINKLLWKKFVKEANQKEVGMSQREMELIAKQSQSNNGMFIGGVGSNITLGSTYPGQWYSGSNGALTVEEAVTLPAGLTEADLVDAHNEACAEDALVGDSTDSK